MYNDTSDLYKGRLVSICVYIFM